MNDDDFFKLQLADTVTIPAADGESAMISFETGGPAESPEILVRAEIEVSVKLSVIRTFRLKDVSALYSPEFTEWRTGSKLADFAKEELNKGPVAKCDVYVREDAPTLLEMKAGMTAGESLEYNPFCPDVDPRFDDSSIGYVGDPFNPNDDPPPGPPTGGG